ncbi:WecB/TagA/CpsF family glycosyltransferase [Parvularcula oceani]|uniref:WecB/TagA/CpsF family glycosyltransferase n=1 Tax=Parvularcula oceani TaxID=1247963 RepID=UPI0006899B23|nr:WecB/TagA/CpsF family glycosyltransferase [Parvularcula oceani]
MLDEDMTGDTAANAPHPKTADPFGRDVIALFGLPFDLLDLESVAQAVLGAAKARERLFLSTANLDWLVTCRTDPAFRASVLASDLVTMDGVPVVALARLAGAGRAEKVAGSDLFDRLRDEDLSVFFFGGREGAADAACAVLEADDRPMRPVGHTNPGFGDLDAMSTEAQLAPANGSGADMLVAALGAAKGQAWLLRNEARLVPPVIAHLGAVVDFVAGTVQRAPRALQVSGFEWAWRIGQDRKLWRRYAADAALLPRLVAEARRIRRLSARLAARAPATAPHLDADDAQQVLRLEGKTGAEALRPLLRQALAAGRPLKVQLAERAAPDLEALGQLLIARTAFARQGVRYDICCESGNARNLCALALGPDLPRLVNGD